MSEGADRKVRGGLFSALKGGGAAGNSISRVSGHGFSSCGFTAVKQIPQTRHYNATNSNSSTKNMTMHNVSVCSGDSGANHTPGRAAAGEEILHIINGGYNNNN